MTFMQEVKKAYNKLKTQIATNPRKCEMCGCVETMKNLILKYDNGKYMCDDCAFTYYATEEEKELYK